VYIALPVPKNSNKRSNQKTTQREPHANRDGTNICGIALNFVAEFNVLLVTAICFHKKLSDGIKVFT
jgi:hypothetical protein